MIRGSIVSVLIFHTVIPEGKRGFESGSKVKDRECRQEKRGKPGVFYESLQKISTHSPLGVILKVDPQPPRRSWQQ
jgi:hypothetical protein